MDYRGQPKRTLDISLCKYSSMPENIFSSIIKRLISELWLMHRRSVVMNEKKKFIFVAIINVLWFEKIIPRQH
jgi:hypothetical protein